MPLLYIRSLMPRYWMTEVSLIMVTNSLPMAGRMFLIACGITMCSIVCPPVMPMERAASLCPTSTAWMPERMTSAT